MKTMDDYSAEALIDAALAEYPLAPLPPRFVRRTMTRVRPRFRFDFLDLALPAFLLLFGVVLTGVAVWMVAALKPLWLLEMQVRIQWYLQNTSAVPWITLGTAWIAVVCGVLLVGVVIAAALDRTAQMMRA
jgi:hypothetical protein